MDIKVKSGELVRIGLGKKAHRKWDNLFTFCGFRLEGIKPGDTESLPLCKTCEHYWEEYKQKWGIK